MTKDLKNCRVLITGGSGFIGSHLADLLIEMKNIVTCYDNFNEYYSGKERNLQKNMSNPNHTLVKADILDFDELLKTVKCNDVIFHLAAQPGVRYSLENPLEVSRINIDGTINVLEASRLADVRNIVFASSSSVYGEAEYLPIDESHPTNPISHYGVSKLSAEKYCKVYGELYGINISILRYFTAFGPRQRPDMAIHKFVKSILNGKSPIIYGDGNQTRDFTYISDIITGTILAAENNQGVDFYNLGGGHRISVNTLIHHLLHICNKDTILKPKYEGKKIGDVEDTHADISKASKILGYIPKVTLEDGLMNFVNWYNSNK